MKRLVCSLVWACCSVLALALSAEAHPPYETVDRIVTGRDGEDVQVVRSFIDGIALADPVKLVFRTTDGTVLSETDYAWHFAIVCTGSRRCMVFQYDGILRIWPTAQWLLRDAELEPATGTGLRLFALLALVGQDWVGYLVALLIPLVPFIVLVYLANRPATVARNTLLTLGAAGLTLVLLPWAYALIFLSRLSVMLVFLLLFPMALLVLVKGAREREALA